MNLYIEASKVLHGVREKTGSIKNLIYKSEFDNKKQLFALVCQTLKFEDVLQEIVDKTQLLKTEKLLKNDKHLAQALLYDFVIGKGLFRAGKLKQTMKRHKASISAECEAMKVRESVTDLSQLVVDNGNSQKDAYLLPRYVRVNSIKTTTDKVIKEFESDGWEQVSYSHNFDSFVDKINSFEEYQFMKDLHIPDLLVFPPGTDLHDNRLCLSGEIILQDKASCFPAFILSPPEGAFVIDCCAAPGNKTSHLASIMKNEGKIFAFDKSKERMKTLKELTSKAGVTCVETFRQDFCCVDPNDQHFNDVEYVLVDPSCSGSGIVNRLDHVTDDTSSSSKGRLDNLAAFQASILLHALKFPNVKKVIYSTCSIHTEENEEVVEKVMSEVCETFKMRKIVADWPERGHEVHEHAQKCLRMSPDKGLTNGFFIACFQRKSAKTENNSDDLHVNELSKRKREDSAERVHEKHKKKKKTTESTSGQGFLGENSEMNEELNNNIKESDTSISDAQTEKHCSKKKKKKDKKRQSDLENSDSTELNGNDESGSFSSGLIFNSEKQRKAKKSHIDVELDTESHIETDNNLENVKKKKKSKKKKEKKAKYES